MSRLVLRAANKKAPLTIQFIFQLFFGFWVRVAAFVLSVIAIVIIVNVGVITVIVMTVHFFIILLILFYVARLQLLYY